ncbi:MAG: TonB-dependent receptor plug domain-containing protein, partial [Pseudomonadota bacterium]
MSSSFDVFQTNIPKKSALAVAVTAALGGQTDVAIAQDSEAGLEEIIVTARKRAESLQDISASIQAFTGADLERQGLQNIEDVVRFLPSVSHLGGTAGANKIIFRVVRDTAENNLIG